VIKGDNGLLRGFVSVNRDISERVSAKENERYQAYLLENIAEAVIATDPDLLIRHWNKAAETLIGIPTEQAIDQAFNEVLRSRLTGEDSGILDTGIKAAIADGSWKGEIAINRADDNRRIPVSLSVTFVVGPDRKSSNLIAVVTDISERVFAQKALEELNISLEGRISTRTAQLASANAKLLELDRVKSQFIADVSHEMRTPLATMKTAIHLLGVDQSEKRDRHLELLHSETNRLTRFVESVLDASRVDLQIHDIYIEPVSIQRILTELCTQTNSKTNPQNTAITLDAPDDVPQVAGDANMLRKMFASVLDNAMKYAPDSSITVTAAYDEFADAVKVQIADTGPGIAPDHLPRVFDRFYRGDHAQSNIPGSGLGLATARIIIDAHQGDIKIESDTGKGTTVTILLPAVKL
jgi:PAS domain S-box-containing protein